MRRVLILFLLVLMPLQFSTAAAAAYCVDEAPTAMAHWNHHDHDAGAAPSTGDDRHSGAEEDCGVCHLFCAKMLSTSSRLDECEPGQRPADFLTAPDPQHAPEPSDRPPIAPLA